jgi:hypothetical protein
MKIALPWTLNIDDLNKNFYMRLNANGSTPYAAYVRYNKVLNKYYWQVISLYLVDGYVDSFEEAKLEADNLLIKDGFRLLDDEKFGSMV